MAPSVATGEAGITAGLACSRIGATGCARASVGLSAGVRTGILVDAVVIGNPGAIAAACSALCHSLVLGAEATRCCCSQGSKCGCEAQAQEHGHEKRRRRGLGKRTQMPCGWSTRRPSGHDSCLTLGCPALEERPVCRPQVWLSNLCHPEPHTVAAGKLRSIAKAILSAPRSSHRASAVRSLSHLVGSTQHQT